MISLCYTIRTVLGHVAIINYDETNFADVGRGSKKQETENEYGQRPKGAIGAQTDFRKNSGVPADGTVGLGATQGGVGFRGSAVGADEKEDRTCKREGAPRGKGQ